MAFQATSENLAAEAAHQPPPLVSAHSSPVADDGRIVAVVAFSYDPTARPVKILSYADGRWAITSSLAQPNEPGTTLAQTPNELPLASSTIVAADVTGDGRPDFLLSLSAADNSPGAVVSEDGSPDGWRYLAFSGSSQSGDVVGRNPVFQGDILVTQHNNCMPDCAQGTTTSVQWSYDRASGHFVPRTGH
jgi:hypothetical protein